MRCLMPLNSEIVMQKARWIVQQKQKEKKSTSQTLPGYQLPIVPVFGDNMVGLPVIGLEHETQVFTASALTARPDSLFAVDDDNKVNRLKYLTRTSGALPHLRTDRTQCAWHPYCAAQRSYCAVHEVQARTWYCGRGCRGLAPEGEDGRGRHWDVVVEMTMHGIIALGIGDNASRHCPRGKAGAQTHRAEADVNNQQQHGRQRHGRQHSRQHLEPDTMG
jgi:hypothetical protein